MPLQITADKLDELPEVLRADAKETNGKFVTGLKDGWAVEDVQGARKALQSERTARKTVAEKLNEFGWKLSEDGSKWVAEGVAADQARDALDKIKSGALKTPKEIEDYKAAIATTFDAKEKQLTTQAGKFRAQLEHKIVHEAAATAIAKAGGGKSLRALMPIVTAIARVEESADGTLRPVLYENGQPLLSLKGGANGAPMGFEEYVENLRGSQDLKVLFEGSGAGGSGSSSQSGGSARPAGNGSEKLPAMERLRRANEKAASGT